MTDHVAKKFKQRLTSITLVPDRGGKFEVSLDGTLLFSKLSEKRFPSNDEIADAIESHLPA